MTDGRAKSPYLLAASVLAASALSACDGDDDSARKPAPPPAETATAKEPPAAGRAQRPVRNQGGPRVNTWVEGLDVPWELAFLPDGRALVTERPGQVRLISRSGRLRSRPVARIDVSNGEGGLLGIAVDPRFRANAFVYVYRTTGAQNQLLRFRFRRGRLRGPRVLVRGINGSPVHDGGRVRFGPDGRLYFSTGDAAVPESAQNPGSLNGKILRLSRRQYRGRGGRPQVFTLGHRNPQGFDWQPRTNRMVENEHGASANDEVNVLRRGGNYGWPEVEGRESGEGFISPVALYESTLAPSGATFVKRGGSEWSGDYLIGCLRGEQIRRVGFSGGEVSTNEALFQGDYGRIRTVVEGPDGALYALTSNRDGRGSPSEGDDRILRIVPPAG
jgi:glucose/arabinose dehydrogenase